jgi:hypothetical protein
VPTSTGSITIWVKIVLMMNPISAKTTA